MTAPARGQDAPAQEEGEGEVVSIFGKAIDPQAGFTTKIDTAELVGETTSVAEVLGRSVGVNVRSLGGLGGYASISIRGFTPSHTAIYLDGVPVSKLGNASHDLGAFELQSFSEIEVFRGAVPMRLGGAAMGGAVEFRSMSSASQRNASVSSGLGAFGAKHLIARVSDGDARWSYLASMGYRGADGDYRYFNDNGTLLRADDDRYEKRRNNDFDMVHAHARATYELSEVTIEAGTRTTLKYQGIPGIGSVQSDQTSLDSISELVDLGFRHKAQGLRVSGKSYVFLDQQVYRDVMGEVGLGNQHNRYRTVSSGLVGDVELLASSAHLLKASLDLSYERFRSHDFLDTSVSSARAWRGGVGAAFADEIVVGSSLKLTPILRVDGQRTSAGLDLDPVAATPDASARFEIFLSPRMTMSYDYDDLELKTSAGRYFRAPTSTELFGDRGFIVGNPELRSETGLSADLGFVQIWEAAPGPLGDIYAQGALFAARQDDTIVLLPSAGGAAQAQNLGSAMLYGIEASMHIELDVGLKMSTNYTLVDSKQSNTLQSYEGKRLPLRPRHQVFARSEYSPSLAKWITGTADVTYTTGNYLDAANLSQVPGRLLLGTGLKFDIGTHMLLGVALKNILDRRVESIALDPAPRADLDTVPRAVSDFLGYPLPGRSFYLTLNASI
ncbi:MAG: TonB-dependent receptor [Myxococcales bacterium]|nr:TonB-dependent receptor [Myxococcales bacterium]